MPSVLSRLVSEAKAFLREDDEKDDLKATAINIMSHVQAAISKVFAAAGLKASASDFDWGLVYDSSSQTRGGAKVAGWEIQVSVNGRLRTKPQRFLVVASDNMIHTSTKGVRAMVGTVVDPDWSGIEAEIEHNLVPSATPTKQGKQEWVWRVGNDITGHAYVFQRRFGAKATWLVSTSKDGTSASTELRSTEYKSPVEAFWDWLQKRAPIVYTED
jgi:hypothetical protein